MAETARVLFHDEAGAPHRLDVPVDRAPLPGERLTLGNGQSVTVLAVTNDREHPDAVIVVGSLEARR
jgi:hypothetical protein